MNPTKAKTEYEISNEQLRKMVHYNPETGVFIWKEREPLTRGDKLFNTRFAGKEAGGLSENANDGYLRIKVKGTTIKAHRLAFVLMGEGWPIYDVDHINGDITDNRWRNLRKTNRKANSRNQKLYNNNVSGYPGIFWHSTKNRWCAQIGSAENREHLGCYNDFNEALEIRQEREVQLGYHENHGRVF